MKSIGVVWGILMAAMVGGCDTAGLGASTGATCPTDNVLTWAEFGQGFMQTYCVECHGSYNTQSRVVREKTQIDQAAGAGDTVTNTYMPESGKKPSLEERKLLSQWLACGAP